MKILIMTGGRTDKGFALGFLQKEAFDICIVADSALEIWNKVEEKLPESYKIDHLVGDFDSVSPEILKKYISREDITVHRFQPEKDYTDTYCCESCHTALQRERREGFFCCPSRGNRDTSGPHPG